MLNSLSKLFYSIIIIFILIAPLKTQADFKNDFSNFLQKAGQSASFDTSAQSDQSYINFQISGAINLIMGLTGLIFLILVIIAGLQWMTSGGNEEKISKSRQKVINGSIGVGITVAAFIITNLVYSYFDAKFLTDPQVNNLNPPPTQEEIDCITDAQCSDRPSTPICHPTANYCVQCIIPEDCTPDDPSDTSQYICDANNFCVNVATGCSGLTKPQCLYDNDCRWENTIGNESETSCISTTEAQCDQQCEDSAPYCLPGTGCVECLDNNDCGFLNMCNGDNECIF